MSNFLVNSFIEFPEAGAFPFTWIYDDTANWTKNGTTVTVDDVIAGICYGNGQTANTFEGVSKPFDSVDDEAISDSEWYMKFDFIIDSGLNYYSKPFLLTAGAGNPQTADQDAIGFGFNGAVSSNATVFWMWKIGSGSFSFISTTDHSGDNLALVKDTQYYITLTRTSTTNITIYVYTDSDRTSQITNSPQSYNMSADIGGLTHLQHGMLTDTANDQAIFKIDNLYANNGALP